MAEENEKDQGQRPGGDSPGPGNGDAAAKSADADVGRVVPDPPKPPPRGGDQKKVVPDPPKPPPRPGAPKKAVPDPPKPPPRPGGSKSGVPDPPKPPPRRVAPSAPAGGEGSADKPAVPKPPPMKPTAPAKPKGPVNEPWSAPLVDAVREKFPDQVLDAYTFLSQRQLVIKKDRFTEIMEFLRRNDVEPFDFLSDETATHWPNEEEFELVYSLFSFETRGRLRVKLRIKEWESVESLTGIWQGADWLEREVYDMYGVRYVNHPNLKRILLPEDWTGFPLRKDYDLRLQDVEWVRKHLGIDSGQKFYVGKAKHED